MKKYLLLLLLVVSFVGCQKETKVKVSENGTISITIPENAPAKDLIQARGVIDNSLTLTAEGREQAFTIAKMKIESSERKFMTTLGVIGAVSGIVIIFALALFKENKVKK